MFDMKEYMNTPEDVEITDDEILAEYAKNKDMKVVSKIYGIAISELKKMIKGSGCKS